MEIISKRLVSKTYTSIVMVQASVAVAVMHTTRIGRNQFCMENQNI